jgi:hypothetical protein
MPRTISLTLFAGIAQSQVAHQAEENTLAEFSMRCKKPFYPEEIATG